MATWSVHYRTWSPGSSKLAQFSLGRKVRSGQLRGGTTVQACAAQQQPVDDYQDWEKKRSRMRKQCRLGEENLQVVAADHRSSFGVSVYVSVHFNPALVSSPSALSRTDRLHPNFSTLSAPSVNVSSPERRGTVLLGEVPMPARRQQPRRKKGGIWAAALATAATSMMLGIAMVGRRHIFPAVPSESSSLMLHPPLPAIRTQISNGYRGSLEVSSPLPTSRGGLDPKSAPDPTPLPHIKAQQLWQAEAWQLADLAVDCIDLTVVRAAAYDSVVQIPDPRRWGCWVSDQAGVMTGQAVEHMNALIDALRYDTGTEITVVTIEAISSESLSTRELAERLFNFWRMDRESDGNSILFLLVRSQGKLEAEVGRALEKTLRQDHLWGAAYSGWLPSLTSRSAWPLTLRNNEPGEALMVAVETLADKVWGAAGLSLYQPFSGASWWQRTRLLDMAWLTVPILFFCANLLMVNKPAASILFGDQTDTWSETLKRSLKTVLKAWVGSAYQDGRRAIWIADKNSMQLIPSADR